MRARPVDEVLAEASRGEYACPVDPSHREETKRELGVHLEREHDWTPIQVVNALMGTARPRPLLDEPQPEPERSLFECRLPGCERVFQTEDNRETHERFAPCQPASEGPPPTKAAPEPHPEPEPEAQESETFVCDATGAEGGCGRKFKTAQSLAMHKVWHRRRGEKRPRPPRRELVVCLVDGCDFEGAKADVADHVRDHAYCRPCGRRFLDTAALEDHIASEHPGDEGRIIHRVALEFTSEELAVLVEMMGEWPLPENGHLGTADAEEMAKFHRVLGVYLKVREAVS